MKKLALFALVLSAAITAFAQDVAVFPQLGHTLPVFSVAFSPDGNQVLSGSWDNTVKLWDANTGKEIRTFSGHTLVISSVTFSPDGSQVLSGSYDKTIKLWDANTGSEIKTFSGHTGGVSSVTYSPDGKHVLSGSLDGTIILWDVNSGRELMTFSGHTGSVNSVSFSHDGRWVLSSSWDNTVKLWDVNSGIEIRTFSGHTEADKWGRNSPSILSGVISVAFSPDSRLVLSGSHDDTIKLWDVNTGQEIRTFSGHIDSVNSVTFSHDGRQVLSGSWDNTVKLWDANTGHEIRTLSGHTYGVTSVTFSPDGRQVLSGSDDNTIKLWDANTGKEIKTFSGHTGGVFSVTFCPDGQQVLSGSGDNTIKLWDANTGKEIRTFSGHTDFVSSVAFSPDGRRVLSGSNDNTIKLWDANTGREIRTFSGHTEAVTSVAFSSDGNVILSGSVDNTVKLWHRISKSELWTFSGHTDIVSSVAFSPDRRQVLSGSLDGTIKLWDTNSGREIKTFSGHTSYVWSVAFSPDGKQVLSGSWDGTIKLWDINTENEIRTFSGHTGPVISVTFSPDGKQVLSGSWDGTVRLWDVSTGKEIAQFISFNDGEWIVITPEGFYNSSLYGDKYLNVRIGNEVFGINQFRETFYQPQIVEARLTGKTTIAVPPVRIQDAAQFAPPKITIRSPIQGSQFTSATTELSVLVEDQNLPITEIQIIVNGRLVGNEELSQLKGTRGINVGIAELVPPEDQRKVEISVPVKMDPGRNPILVRARNRHSKEDKTVEVSYQASQANQEAPPNLWILTVGVNKYNSKDITDLRYAVNDAREIIKAFKEQEGKRFNKVNSLLISDDAELKPTAANIIDNLSFLRRAGQKDVILLFLAGHGKTDSMNDFYFCSSDTVINEDGSIRPSSAVAASFIVNVSKLPGTKIIFIDSCHSESVSGTRKIGSENDALIRELLEPTTTVFNSCKANEFSKENEKEQHGVFTYAILKGLKGEADKEGRGRVTMMSLQSYVSDTVQQMTSNAQHPNSTVLNGSNGDFILALTK